MIWAVVDTNLMVSAFGWGGRPGVVVDRAAEGDYVLVTSEVLLDELQRVLVYPKIAAAIETPPSGLVAAVRDIAELVSPKRRIFACRDESDNRLLEAAVEADVDFIVSGDDDLLALEEHHGIPIVTAAKFLGLLEDAS